MKIPFYCVLFFTVLGFLVPAAATPLEDKATTLKKAIATEIASKSKTSDSTNPHAVAFDQSRMDQVVDELLSSLDNPGSYDNIEIQLNQMLTNFTSSAVMKAKKDFLNETHAERKAKQDAFTAQVNDLLKHASDTINQATKPEALDDLLVELQNFQIDHNSNGRYGYNPGTQELQKVSSAFEFTKLWQNYLYHSTAGINVAAHNDLLNLSQNNYGVGIIPRSRILKLMDPPDTAGTSSSTSVIQNSAPSNRPEISKANVTTILLGIKTLDDMAPAMEKLNGLRTEEKSSDSFKAAADLKTLVEAYETAKVDLPSDIEIDTEYRAGSSIAPDLLRQLLLFAFRHRFTSYKGPAPAPDEKLDAYVDRVVADAINRQDWTLLKQSLKVREYLDSKSSLHFSSIRNYDSGISFLMAGINQEEAGQYELAVASYQNALKQLPDQTIPPKLIGDKLASIQKSHPKEYEVGMQLTQGTPATALFPSTTNPPPPALPSTNALSH